MGGASWGSDLKAEMWFGGGEVDGREMDGREKDAVIRMAA